MSKVSIIIPFYNCKYVDQAIESALRQTYENTEVIVVNDGSTKYEEKLTPFLNRIRYIKKGNGGTATALNLGIKRATGQYFTWLSSDDIYDRDKVFKQIAWMKQRDAAISYTSYFHINARNQVLGGPVGIYFPTKLALAQNMRQGCPINGCTVMMRMDLFKQVGLFDPSLPYTHDYDLWLRILPHHQFHYINEPLVLHRIHAEMGTKKYHSVIQREIQFVQRKHQHSLSKLINREGMT